MALNIQFTQFTLDNGLRVIVHEDHRIPIVAVNIWYGVGSKNERPGKTGFAHLFEHMMFQGSAHIAADLHFKLIQSVGGTLNGSTFFDRTNYFETLPSHYLEMGLWLEADRMGWFLPALDQKKLDNQLEVVKNERRQHMDNMPYGLWLEKLLGLSYAVDYPYHWPVIGYMEDLETISMEEVRRFFKTYYCPNNASLVVAGDFDLETIRGLIEKYFAEIEPGEPLPAFNKPFADYNRGEKRTLVKDHVQLPRLYMGYHIPGLGTKQAYTADLITDILSSGKSARLYQSLIHRQQIAQDAQAILLPLKETSLLILMLTPRPGISVEKAEQALQEEIELLISEPMAEEELQRVKNQIESRKLRELETMSARADYLNMYNMYFNKPQLINTEIDRYKAISRDEVRQVAAEYLQSKNRAVVTFLPTKP